MAPQIPDRWLKYQPIGQPIEGTRFIAFKVPLRENVNKSVAENDRLHGRLLLEEVPNMGVIIDLTNTNRYYDPQFFEKEGVKYIKLMIPGQLTPPPALVNRFKKYVNDFLHINSDNDKLIGVHCTHGVNRTGYLICNYMVSEMAVDPREAIRKFAVARGHKIERQNYIDSLYTLMSSPKGLQDNATTVPRERNQSKSYKEHDRHRNWRTERSEHSTAELSWRTHREPPETSASSSRQNWRHGNLPPSNHWYTEPNRSGWRSSRNNNAEPQDTRNSVRDRKRKYRRGSTHDEDNDETRPTEAKTMRPSVKYERFSSGSNSYHNNDHRHSRQFRNSHNPNNAGSSHTNSHRSSNSNSTSADNRKSTRHIQTDYYNASRQSRKRERSSHSSQRQQ